MNDDFKKFEKRVNKSLANMDAKISFLHDATGQVKQTFVEFKEEMTDFMQFMAEHIPDRSGGRHETRISRLEKNAGLK